MRQVIMIYLSSAVVMNIPNSLRETFNFLKQRWCTSLTSNLTYCLPVFRTRSAVDEMRIWYHSLKLWHTKTYTPCQLLSSMIYTQLPVNWVVVSNLIIAYPTLHWSNGRCCDVCKSCLKQHLLNYIIDFECTNLCNVHFPVTDRQIYFFYWRKSTLLALG